MLSIFIMYSTDRFEALDYTISCLKDMKLYKESQKTLVVDGKIDKIPKNWEVVQVPRFNNKFCWAKMWDAGVLTSQNEKIVYLDSDRLLPSNFLELIYENLEDNLFLFTSFHFMMQQKISLEKCKKILNSSAEQFKEELDLSFLRYEPLQAEPFHGSGKNVMSGCTAFTRKTYLKLGGVDHWYCGHGAFADSDFHMQAASAGCEFVDLQIPQIHFIHKKLDNNQNSLKDKDLWLLSLENFIYYCQKWKLPMALAESMAVRCDIKNPHSYVSKKLKQIMANAKEC